MWADRVATSPAIMIQPGPRLDPRTPLTALPVPLRLAVGSVALILGLFPLLAGVGAIRTDEGIEPVGRVVVILFGAVFVTLGWMLLESALLEAARARGAVTRGDAARMALRHVRARPTWASGGAALGVALVAAGHWLAVAGVTVAWMGGAAWLRAIVIIEFLVIHGFPFMVVAVVLARNSAGGGRIAGRAMLGGLVLLYAAFAWKAGDGVWGVAALLYLMVPNVLAFARPHAGVSDRVLVVSRWAIKFTMLVLTAAVVGESSFDLPGVLWIGAVYFTLLAGVEAYRVVEMPGELMMLRDRGVEG
jgi:hypothetical protein